MSDHNESGAPRVGDRVRLWMGTEVRGTWEYGTVTGVDDETGLHGKTIPGISIAFDRRVNGIYSCYATHAEVEVVTHLDSCVADEEFAQRYRAQYERIASPGSDHICG